MCDSIHRRSLLSGVAALAGLGRKTATAQQPSVSKVNVVDPLSTGIYFHEGDIAKEGHCNNGWIILRDYVLVIDANFPSGAKNILPKIRALTDKPVRFAFDTHHHGDHAYGNQVWIENGATPIAHTGVLEEMKRLEPRNWDNAARTRKDVAESRLTPPTVLFPKELYFDDGAQRVELIHFGTAHTKGDAFAWLPSQRILFTGDACVNGAYNFVGDGNIEQWIVTLDAAKKLGARLVCPGHGPRGEATLLDDQQRFFKTLREQVGKAVSAKKTPKEVSASVEAIRGEITSDPRIARYAGSSLGAQVQKVWEELTGQKWTAELKAANVARLAHHRDHRHEQA
jgi:cyclase